MSLILRVFWINLAGFVMDFASHARLTTGGRELDGFLAFMSPTAREPIFDSYLSHVTVLEGQEAVLPCSVDNLNKLKVVWLDSNSMTLTLGERRIVDDTRFSISRQQQSSWNLVIKESTSSDAGRYLCAVNTMPIKNKMVELTVKVPAKILEAMSSKDQIVREGNDLSIVCRTSGVPSPIVTWVRKWRLGWEVQREHTNENQCIYIGSTRTTAGAKLSGDRIIGMGEVLTILNISRVCSDIYECSAQNEMFPAVKKEIKVQVEFAPEINPISRRISQAIGRETILECEAKAFPHAINYWEKNGSRLKNSEKYRIEAYNGISADLLILSLRIFNIEKQDFGLYSCIAANSLGNDKSVVLLEEYEPATGHHQPLVRTTEKGIDKIDEHRTDPSSAFSSKFHPIYLNSKQQQRHLPWVTVVVKATHVPLTTRGRSYKSFEYLGQHSNSNLGSSIGTASTSAMFLLCEIVLVGFLQV